MAFCGQKMGKSQRQKQNNVSETDRFKPVNYTEKDRRLFEINVVVFGLKMIEDFSNTNMGFVEILRPQSDAAGLCQDI